MRVFVNASSALRGGGVTFAVGLISRLAACDIDLVVVASPEVRMQVNNESIHWVTATSSSLLRVCEAMFLHTLSSHQMKADVVLFLGNYGSILDKSTPCVVVAQQDFAAGRWERHWIERLRWAMLRLLMQVSYRRAHRVICVSQALADRVHDELGVHLEKLTVVHEGAPHVHRRLDKGTGIVALAGTQPYKAGHVLAQGLTMLSRRYGVPVKIAGVSRQQARLLGWAGTDGELEWLGYVPYDELMRLLATSQLFVYQSLVESFGLPPLEAMAHGAVVVAPDIPAVREVCGAAAEYFDPCDVNSLADTVGRIWKRSDLMTTLQAKGYEMASSYSWEKAGQSVFRVLQETAANRRP